jgi:hypothetical protein
MNARQLFKHPAELAALGIIDFRRIYGYWKSEYAAAIYLGGLLVDVASFVIYDVPDFDAHPERDDWPGWSHVGSHPAIGRKMWDSFHHHFPRYKLTFGDQPDFQAIKEDDEGGHFIWGDIGQVSPHAFALTLNAIRPDDMWISILDEGRRHVVITFHTSFASEVGARKDEEPNKAPEPTTMAVTPRAMICCISRAYFADARGAPAMVVAHL